MMPTLGEFDAFWSFIGKVGAILLLVVGIIEAYKKLRSQTPVAKLEDRMNKHDTYLDNDKRHLEELDRHIVQLDKKISDVNQNQAKESSRINASLNMLGTSMSALINHMIDGNGIDKMKEERDALNNFFYNRSSGN